MIRAEALVGIALLWLAWAGPASAQLCLGRTPAGEGSLEVAVMAAPGVPGRLSAGDQVGDGPAWRVGVIAINDHQDGFRVSAFQLEAAFERPLNGRARFCPGVSVARTFPGVDRVDALTAVDLFVGFGFPVQVQGPATVVPFVTPHLAFAATRDLEVANPNGSSTTLESGGDLAIDAVVGATMGVGVFIGRVRIRGMFSLAALVSDPAPAVQPLLGFGLGWSPH